MASAYDPQRPVVRLEDPDRREGCGMTQFGPISESAKLSEGVTCLNPCQPPSRSPHPFFSKSKNPDLDKLVFQFLDTNTIHQLS